MFDSFVTLWIVACQAPLSMGFPRQEYRSELPFPSPGYLSRRVCVTSPDDANDGTWATFCHLALIEKWPVALDSLVVEKTAETQQFFPCIVHSAC